MHTMSRRLPATDTSRIDRRTALVAVGTVAVGGGGLLSLAGHAHAEVSMDSFDVADAEFEAEQITPELVVDLRYGYDAGTEAVSAVRFGLVVGGDEIASERLDTSRAVFEGQTGLTGRLTDSSAWDASDFAVEVGETVTRDVSVRVVFEVLDRSDSVLVSDTASDTATVEIAHPQANAWTATVGGTGTIQDAE